MAQQALAGSSTDGAEEGEVPPAAPPVDDPFGVNTKPRDDDDPFGLIGS